MADELLPHFCKDGAKEEVGEELKINGWTTANPNPTGHNINYLFNNIFYHLNRSFSQQVAKTVTTAEELKVAVADGLNVNIKSGSIIEVSETLILHDKQIIYGNNSTLIHLSQNELFSINGGLGESTVTTEPITTNVRSIHVSDASLFEEGETIRIISTQDSLESSAGSWRLGRHTSLGFPSYFAEFMEIERISGNILFFTSTVAFPKYPAGSSISKVNFVTIVIKDLTVDSRTNSDIMDLDYHKNTILENVYFNKNKHFGVSIELKNNYKSKILNCNFSLDADTKMRYGEVNSDAIEDFPSFNSVKLSSCQYCIVDGGNFTNGSQNVDVTYRNYPSLHNVIQNTTVINAKFNFHTSHWGTMGTVFQNNTGTCIRGISYRGRADILQNNKIYGSKLDVSPYTENDTYGLQCAGGWTIDSKVNGNTIIGFKEAWSYLDYSAGIIGHSYIRQDVGNNVFENCFNTFVITRSPSGSEYHTANKSGLVIKNNTIKLNKSSVLLAKTSYINGVTFRDNTIVDNISEDDFIIKFKYGNCINNMILNNVFPKGAEKLIYLRKITNTELLGANTLVDSGNKSFGNILLGKNDETQHQSQFGLTQVSFLNFTPPMENVDYYQLDDAQETTLNTNGASVLTLGNSTGEDIHFNKIIGHVGQRISLYGTASIYIDSSTTIQTMGDLPIRLSTDKMTTFVRATSKWVQE